MCDYSLHLVASRPAQVGDKLVTTRFRASYTRGFAAISELGVAVCLLPGTELAFDQVVEREVATAKQNSARYSNGCQHYRMMRIDWNAP
jgi:hypothetical protein